MPALRLVFFGTPEIAVPTLERLIAGPHEVVGVVSQPDRARGRGRKTSPSPVSAVALRDDIPLLRPENIGDPEAVETLSALRPDVGIVVAFGQFLPRKVRELPSRGYLINAHASLLPSYRGASPIAQAILDGELETGVSVMRIEREMDAGPVALMLRTPIEPRENTAELSNRLAELAAAAIEQTVEKIARGDIEWTAQDETRVTIAPKLEKSDGVLDLREGAQALASRIHALSPKPGGALTLVTGNSDSSVDSSDESSRKAPVDSTLKISRADWIPFDESTQPSTHPRPGTIERDVRGSAEGGSEGNSEVVAEGVALRIATGEGWLVPLVLQRAGGKALPIADFLRGFELGEDACFALPNPNSEKPE